MTPVLEVRKLSKLYGSLSAVNGISFSVRPGICFGLLGPNGAGKTTTIEIIEGIKSASSGEILFKGQPVDKEFRKRCGIQFQQTALPDFMTTREALALFSRFYSDTLPQEELIRLCHLEEYLDQFSNKLSGGQRQRLLLALALVNDPEIIFLDEPTTGLDPQARRNFWTLIKDIKARGTTVILTTHYMDEAELLCDELAIMDHGHIIAQGTPAGLLKEHFNESRICLDNEVKPLLPPFWPEPVDFREEGIEIRSKDVPASLQDLINAGVPLQSLKVRVPSLEDLFIKLTGHDLRS